MVSLTFSQTSSTVSPTRRLLSMTEVRTWPKSCKYSWKFGKLGQGPSLPLENSTKRLSIETSDISGNRHGWEQSSMCPTSQWMQNSSSLLLAVQQSEQFPFWIFGIPLCYSEPYGLGSFCAIRPSFLWQKLGKLLALPLVLTLKWLLFATVLLLHYRWSDFLQ